MDGYLTELEIDSNKSKYKVLELLVVNNQAAPFPGTLPHWAEIGLGGGPDSSRVCSNTNKGKERLTPGL